MYRKAVSHQLILSKIQGICQSRLNQVNFQTVQNTDYTLTELQCISGTSHDVIIHAFLFIYFQSVSLNEINFKPLKSFKYKRNFLFADFDYIFCVFVISVLINGRKSFCQKYRVCFKSLKSFKYKRNFLPTDFDYIFVCL